MRPNWPTAGSFDSESAPWVFARMLPFQNPRPIRRTRRPSGIVDPTRLSSAPKFTPSQGAPLPDESRPPLAYRNEDFLDSDDARPLRILAEYIQPLQAFRRHRIRDTVVF